MPQPTTRRPWTDDTRIAFLLGLRLHGTTPAAAHAIGRVPGSCHGARKRDAVFAAKWDAILAEQVARRRTARSDARAAARAAAKAAEDGRRVERDASGNRARWSGVTQVKRRAFLRALSESGTVEAACRAAQVSDTAAYRLRAADADFAAAWDRALRTAAPALDQVAWERAVEGWEEPIFRNGVQVGTRRRYSEPLLRQLIVKREKAAALADDPAALLARAEEAARAAGGFFGTPATREETNAAILAKLAIMERRLAAERARAEGSGAGDGSVPRDESGAGGDSGAD